MRTDYGAAAAVFVFIPIVAVILVFVLARSLLIIFAQPTRQGERAMAWKIAKKSVRRIAIVVVLGSAVKYWMDVGLRSKAHECQKKASASGRYMAELCLLQWNPGDESEYRGRVYDARNGQLLVERTFRTPVPELAWGKDENVSFSRGGDDSSLVTLPPSLYDRLTAQLP